MWNAEQCERLAAEEGAIGRHMPQFCFYDRSARYGDTYLEGWVRTALGGNYQLRLVLPPDYPYVRPNLYVIFPKPLWMYGYADTLNAVATPSHSYHIQALGPDGSVEICHTHLWDPSMTIVKALLKGAVWCTAYEGHLQLGNTIHEVLEMMKEGRWP